MHTCNFGFCLLDQNSTTSSSPAPKQLSMIDEWAASVKPKANPVIISKHIEKMVDVREKLTFL